MPTKTLTIFTPAYNRAHTIGRTYESLCRQTLQDFEWLVVDDGSSDNTRELVEGWIAEGRIPIRYIYQENQGMHGAHNTAYRNITTPLNTCVDSDDWMPDDAVEKIVSFWWAHFVEPEGGAVETAAPSFSETNAVVLENERSRFGKRTQSFPEKQGGVDGKTGRRGRKLEALCRLYRAGHDGRWQRHWRCLPAGPEGNHPARLLRGLEGAGRQETRVSHGGDSPISGISPLRGRALRGAWIISIVSLTRTIHCW